MSDKTGPGHALSRKEVDHRDNVSLAAEKFVTILQANQLGLASWHESCERCYNELLQACNLAMGNPKSKLGALEARIETANKILGRYP